jgi:hypothetical protein
MAGRHWEQSSSWRGAKVMKKIVLAALVVLCALGYAAWRHQYPYGYSHCCDLQLYQGLAEYARTHGGAFPAGEATPEASLSLLYREKAPWGGPLADADLLRGKTVPESVVKGILEHGKLLAPETCGWHYVDELRLDDDHRLALFWDKAGLTHNGGRMSQGGHIVMFVSGFREHITETEWESFLKEQQTLLAQRATAIHHDATIQIDNREVQAQVRVVDDYIYGSTWNSREAIATTKKQEFGIQGLPVIPIEEIKNARVVVEQARVRFVLRDREIVYDRSGFRVETTPSEATRK